MEASAASMSTTERFDDVAGSGDAEQPPPTGAAHEATAVQHLRPMPDDDPLSDRAAGEAPSASIVSSSDAVESTPCPKCANKHARTNHTCSKARKAPTVSALPARASRRSRSDAGSVADQPASKAPRLSMPHATSHNAACTDVSADLGASSAGLAVALGPDDCAARACQPGIDTLERNTGEATEMGAAIDSVLQDATALVPTDKANPARRLCLANLPFTSHAPTFTHVCLASPGLRGAGRRR